ncbi:MAG: dienelactone hydrolase family protein [Alphaproteobacteria bacterium]|nr:dienelactone hydrolase family protein [Alphaproteobacteria bacterium]
MIRAQIFALALVLGLPVGAAGAWAQERVEFPSGESAGTPPLIAWLSKPVGSGPDPAVVMLHGCGGAYNAQGQLNMRHRQWERAFREAGYVVLQLDSFTSRNIKEVCTLRDRPITPSVERRRDALAALAYLRARRDVMADQVALVGWSNGASTVLAVMERRAGDAPDLRYRAGIAFYPGCRVTPGGATYDPAGPLLILSGERDDWTPPASCQAMTERARAKGEAVGIHIYAGAFHDFDWPGLKTRTRTGLPFTRDGTATVGEDPPARADALIRAPEFLANHLRN